MTLWRPLAHAVATHARLNFLSALQVVPSTLDTSATPTGAALLTAPTPQPARTSPADDLPRNGKGGDRVGRILAKDVDAAWQPKMLRAGVIGNRRIRERASLAIRYVLRTAVATAVGAGRRAKPFRNPLEWAEIGDRIGISYAWAQEHHFLEEYSHSTAPEVLLSAVSQRTERMRIGHGISLMPPAYNHPARVAERIATLDLVSQGRVEWGTGESSSRIELEGFGVNCIEKRAMWFEAVTETAKILASTPYPGYQGRYFSMPARNVVPKPVQSPHPRLWVACTKKETMKMAARLGMGALTFSFMTADDARYWVKEYYDTFKNECEPIGQTVNPNIAMLAGFMVHKDHATAVERGLEGQQFVRWALRHYYRFGSHVPGHTDLWAEFKKASPEPVAGTGGVGDPEHVREHFRGLEEAGVDQLMLLQQCGKYEHDHICESLELAGQAVLPECADRHTERKRRKDEELAPYIDKALAKIPPIEPARREAVHAYPVQWQRD